MCDAPVLGAETDDVTSERDGADVLQLIFVVAVTHRATVHCLF